jgi:ubiquinone biosynthesis accessory factor UbiK
MINEFAQRLSQDLQQALPLLAKLLPKRELQLAIQSALGKLSLVSREEFDAQTAVLQRTRSRLEQLEARCAQLEQQLHQKPEQ